ncbi:MAG TPA: ATP-binding protein, partial [Gemmataceae bacterium]|nr:ATP-binding protein [Gemmataceae bacterium]
RGARVSLTTRLSLFFLAALAVVLVAFSLTLYLLADVHLHRQLDDRLEAAARTLSSAAEVEPDGVEWEPGVRPLALSHGSFGDHLCWAVTTDEGRVIDRSKQPEAEELLAAARAAPGEYGRPRRLVHAGRAWRVIRLRLAPEPAPLPRQVRPEKLAALTLTVAVPLEPVQTTLRTLAAALAGLMLVVLVVALIAGRAVCRRAVAPVARMADAARSMGAADLHDRLPVPPSADELADLGTAFNGLLERLAEAFERERRFAGEASHQLRTPLAGLIGQVEVALRRDRPAEEYRRALESVLNQAGRLRRVVEALLFLARSEGEARLLGVERIDLAVWVPDRLRAWSDHPRWADLVCGPWTGGPLPVEVHPDLFGELLDALLDNALKYSPSGTPVAVRLGRDDGGAWVEVEDRGCGVAAEDLPHLFRPFFRSDLARKAGVPGAGLGLAVAARVAAALGGSIEVDSEPGRGSRFQVRLPRCESAAEVIK